MSTVAEIVSSIAQSLGVDSRLAIAAGQVESGLNPQAIGDSGSSFGVFQLHRGGELGSLTPAQAFDPATNARVALSRFADVIRTHPQVTDPGQIAALAQRPADPVGYARKVDDALSKLGGIPGALIPGVVAGNAVAGGLGVPEALAGLPASVGHGLADFLGAGLHNFEVFFQNEAVAILVAVVVVLVIFL